MQRRLQKKPLAQTGKEEYPESKVNLYKLNKSQQKSLHIDVKNP